MKTTMQSHAIANPRRTNLMHLDAVQDTREQPEHSAELPASTANPRRTVLMTAPKPHAHPAATLAGAAEEPAAG
jgi:hypothetical protein